MKKWFPWVLILGGAAIAAIVYWGSTTVSKKSDAQILQEAMLKQQAGERARQEEAASLSKKVLPAPDSCEGLTTGVVYAICETEPDPGGDWPDWTALASVDQQTCIVDTFHQTNAHAFAIRGETYEAQAPSGNKIGWFVSDLCGASLFTDGIDWGDEDASLADLIVGFYTDRADSSVRPSQSYE